MSWIGLLFFVLWTLFVAGCGSDDPGTAPTTTGVPDGGTAGKGGGGGGAGGGGAGKGGGGTGGTVPEAGPGDADTSVPPDSPPDSPVLMQLATPTFTPVAETFMGSVDVTINVAMLPPGGTIFYTTNGTNPNTGSLVYNGPIHFTQTTTLRAFATAPSRLDSAVGVATYVITPMPIDSGAVGSPNMVPMSSIQNNDFPVAITTATAGATVCYTLDGSVPACANGVCEGTAQTYNAASRVPISGTVTDATGKVTLTAIGCAAGLANSTVAKQSYTLQVADPAMVSPAPGNLAYQNGGYAPTISSATSGSTMRYTTLAASPPTCITGTAAANPSTVPVTSGITYYAIACKANYAPSAVSSSAFTVTLNAPGFDTPEGTYDREKAVTLTDASNAGSGDWLCSTKNGGAPSCGGAANTCATGTVGNSVSVTATGTKVTAVACSTAHAASAIAAATYTLKLSPPDLSPPGTNAGVPLTAANIPANLVGNFHPTIEQTGTGSAPWAHACAITNGTPVCSSAGCSTGTKLAVNAPLPGVSVAAGDKVSVVGCPGNGANFLASDVTTVTYSGAGSALAPSIAPASAKYDVRTDVIITNQDPVNAQTICHTVDGTAPTCSSSPLACTHGAEHAAVAHGASFTLDAQSSNAEQVKAVACTATQTQSPTTSNTYLFQVRQPDITKTTKGDLNGGGSLQVSSITLSTDSDFAGVTLHWNTGGTPSTCATGTVINGATGSIAVPIGTSPLTINVIGCGTAQQSSSVRTATFNLAAATPTIDVATGTYENTFTAMIASATANQVPTTICYHKDGTQPSCNSAGMCDVNSTVGTDSGAGVPVSITASNTRIRAVACTSKLTQSPGTGSADYKLQVSRAVVTPSTGCPASVHVELDQSGGVGLGPTRLATICYSRDGITVPLCPEPATPQAGVVCFNSGAAGDAASPPVTLTPALGTVKACSSVANFDNGVDVTQSYVPSFVQTIAVDGNLADFVAAAGATQLDTTSGAASHVAYFAYDTTKAYVALDSEYTPSADTVVAIFLGDGTAGTTAGPGALGGPTLPTPATYMIEWQTNNALPASTFKWSGTAWVAAGDTAPTVGYQTGSHVEIGVPLANFGSPQTITVSGAVVTGVGSTPVTAETWPDKATSGTAYGHFVRAVRASCMSPNTEITP